MKKYDKIWPMAKNVISNDGGNVKDSKHFNFKGCGIFVCLLIIWTIWKGVFVTYMFDTAIIFC